MGRQHPASWVEELTASLALPFDTRNEPPMRFLWVRGDDVSEIIVLSDHTFVDGYSAVHVVRDLVAHLADPELEVERHPLSIGVSELIPAFSGRRLAI